MRYGEKKKVSMKNWREIESILSMKKWGEIFCPWKIGGKNLSVKDFDEKLVRGKMGASLSVEK